MLAQRQQPRVTFRDYDPEVDRGSLRRIWLESGWIEEGKEEIMDIFVGCGRALIAEVNGAAECMVTTAPGSIRYLDEDLPFSCVTGVTTGRVVRKQGLASRLTALAVAHDAAEGALVSGLGMFEQGYYNQLGFGTGVYEHTIAFDPCLLRVEAKPGQPRRLTREDWELVHASRLTRRRGHGSCSLTPAGHTRAEMLWSKNGFGLGYSDEPDGHLTHHVWFHAEEVELGPYYVMWLSFRNAGQFLELMALVRNLGDQIRLVKMFEPPGIQLQDLIERPIQQRLATEKSRFESAMASLAFWQMRICNLEGCLARTYLRGGDEVRFNVKLTDPIERFLDDSAPWRGLSGDHIITLGQQSGAEPGADSSLPTLKASVGAFTRLWLGVRPATGLAATDELVGPPDLLEKLDWLLRLPAPKPDWEF